MDVVTCLSAEKHSGYGGGSSLCAVIEYASSLIQKGGEGRARCRFCQILQNTDFLSAPSVTVSVDDFKIDNDVKCGELVEVSAVVNRAFNTSMEVRAQHSKVRLF